MKNIKLLSTIAVLAVLFLASCSSLTVNADYDKTADFTQYKTYSYYGWSQDSDQLLNQLDKQRIEKAFGAEFSKRGLKNVKEGGDLIVTLFIVTQQKQQTTATTTSMGGYGGYGGYYGYGPGYGMGGGMSTTNYNTYDYTVGTLVVDMYDAKAQQLIYESSGSGTIDENPKNRDKTIPQTVSAIMKSFPIAPIPTK